MNKVDDSLKRLYKKVPVVDEKEDYSPKKDINISDAEKENLQEKDKIKSDAQYGIPLSYGCGIRHLQALLVFTCLFVNFIVRAHPAVTIVAMVVPNNHTNVDDVSEQLNVANVRNDNQKKMYTEISNGNGFEIGNQSVVRSFHDDVWEFNKKYSWAPWTQEFVLGAFFVGYALAMWPGGLVIQRIGGKLPLQAGLLVGGLLSIATPLLASVGGWQAVAVSRVITGMAQASTYPSASALIARWVPSSERATFGTYVFTGATIGTIVAFQLGGVLAASPWGWPSTFYASGTLCLIAFTLFTIFGHRSPAHHPTISSSERNYIIGKIFIRKEKRLPVPWCHLLSSPSVWAAFATQFGSACVYMFIFTQAPTYMHYILGINVKSSGFLSSLPYVANALTAIGMGLLSDYCTNRGLVSVRTARIVSNTIGAVGPALCLIALGYTQRTDLAVLAFVLAMTAYAGTITGWMVNYIDLAPNFSGAIMATGNTLMNFASIGLPIIIAHIVTDQHNHMQWRVVLLLVSAVSILCNVLFAIFMSPTALPWNEPKESELKEMETKQLKISTDI